MSTKYRRYHSELKVEYSNGNLPWDIAQTIPRSTRQRWKNSSPSSFWVPFQVQSTVADELRIRKLKEEVRILKAKLKCFLFLTLLYRELMSLLSLKSTHVLKTRVSVERLLSFCLDHGFASRIFSYLPFTFKQWNSWSGRKFCFQSIQNYCRRQNTQQLTIEEQYTIQEECAKKEYKNWPLCSVYYQLLREKKVSCAQSTFFKYCKLFKITRNQHKRKKRYNPILTDQPLKVLHQDITIFKTANGVKQYVYVVRDNFSKAILACKVATKYCSRISRQTLEGVLKRFNLMDKPGTLITDDGVENKGEVDKFLRRHGMLWQKLVAQIDIVQSNSMVEAINKILKYRYLYPRIVNTTSELKEILEKAVEDFNSMPNRQLYGNTPNEVLFGKDIDRNFFREQLDEARLRRMGINQKFDCRKLCQT